MGKNEKTPIVIDGAEFLYEDMSPEQQMMVNHISDLDRKIGNARFNLDQLSIGRNAFMGMLTSSLNVVQEVE